MDKKEDSGNIIDKAKDTVSNITEKVVEMKEDMFDDEQSEIKSEFKDTGLNKN